MKLTKELLETAAKTAESPLWEISNKKGTSCEHNWETEEGFP